MFILSNVTLQALHECLIGMMKKVHLMIFKQFLLFWIIQTYTQRPKALSIWGKILLKLHLSELLLLRHIQCCVETHYIIRLSENNTQHGALNTNSRIRASLNTCLKGPSKCQSETDLSLMNPVNLINTTFSNCFQRQFC